MFALNKQKSSKEKLPTFLFIFFLILLILFAIFSCVSSDISGDEFFSYSTANNEQGFLYYTLGNIDEFFENGWIDNEHINRTLTVADGEQFDILSTYRQARRNVHPPLFYMILHMSSALIPGEFSHWTGSILNILYYTATIIMLYKLSQLLVNNKNLALFPSLIWGFSFAADSLVSYIRMYLPLCLTCLIIMYFHVKLLSDSEWTKINLIFLAGFVTIGALLHHYFYVFLGFSCVTYFIILLVKKSSPKKIITYCLTIFSGILVELCLYPYSIQQIFFSYRGEETQANLVNTDISVYINNIKLFWAQINEKAFNSYFKYIFIIVTFILIFGFFFASLRKRQKPAQPTVVASVFSDSAKYAFIYILSSGLIYTLVLSKVSYAMLWTYISPAYIPAIICTFMVTIWAVQKSFTKYNLIISVLLLTLLTISYIPQGLSKNFESYYKFKAINNALQPHYGSDVLFCYEEWDNIFYGRMLEMCEMDEIHPLDCNELDTLDIHSICETRDTKDNLLLYVPYRSEQKDSYVEKVATQLEMNALPVYEYNRVAVYKLN